MNHDRSALLIFIASESAADTVAMGFVSSTANKNDSHLFEKAGYSLSLSLAQSLSFEESEILRRWNPMRVVAKWSLKRERITSAPRICFALASIKGNLKS